MPSDAFPRLKICQKCVCGRGSAPYPAGGAYSAHPDPLAAFKGPTSKGMGGEGREGVVGGKGEEREGAGGEKGRRGKGREGGKFDPHFSLPSAAPAYNNKP